jgi:hypothetical protein
MRTTWRASHLTGNNKLMNLARRATIRHSTSTWTTRGGPHNHERPRQPSMCAVVRPVQPLQKPTDIRYPLYGRTTITPEKPQNYTVVRPYAQERPIEPTFAPAYGRACHLDAQGPEESSQRGLVSSRSPQPIAETSYTRYDPAVGYLAIGGEMCQPTTFESPPNGRR